MGINLSTIFLMSVLVLGLASYPLLSNPGNSIGANDDLLRLGIGAFAQEAEEEEAEEEEEIEIEEDEEKILEIEEDAKLKVKAEIFGDRAKVKIEREFYTTTIDRVDIINEIIQEFALSRDSADAALELEIEEEEEFDEKFEVKVEVEEGVAEVEVKLEFILDTTDREEILNAIVEKTQLSTEQIEGVIEFEIEEVKEEVEEERDGEETRAPISVPDTDEKITICHIPPGNPSNAHTITIDMPALETHLEHGDYVGSCEDELEPFAEREARLGGEKLEKETEIEVEIKKGKAKVKVEFAGEKSRFLLQTTDESEIISAIERITGLTESQIKEIWEFETEDGLEEDEREGLPDKAREARLAEKMAKNEFKTRQVAEDRIAELEQKIEQLEQRVRSLLDKLETGEYFGPAPVLTPVYKSYSISFDGLATSLDDNSIVNDISGDIFMEIIKNREDVSKFRVTGGEILIGDTFYDVIFGKARSTLGPSGEKDSMILLAQIMDDEGNITTLKILLDPETPLEGDFGLESVNLEFKMPQSKIARQWSLSASGQLSLLQA